jgi:hypothetical protein
MPPARPFARYGVLLWFASCSVVFAAAPVRDWPEVPSPPGASTYWIAQYLEQNTIPMQIRGFDTPMTAAEVEDYYRKWFADKVGFGASNIGDVRVLGARMGSYQVTVQLGAKLPGTVGRVSLAAVYESGETGQAGGKTERERIESIGRGFPRPAGSQVISDTLSFDTGQRNRTIVLMNNVSIETNALYLREQLLRLGWTLLQDRTVEAGQRSALVFRRGPEEMVVTIAKHEDAYIVISSQTTPD